ncbi:MAG: winged helix-turn-helix domain-containing protein [bacterium]|nr:winged helix-turn-helix domain-containing protein [bacterium]
MLDKLFGSKTRVKILKLFLLHPAEKFYIRQLARDLKLQLNSVRRELENLENFGILTSAVKGEEAGAESDAAAGRGQEKKYFRANPDFILFDEIKALIVKAQVLYEKDFSRKLQSTGKVKLLILTGIFVNNQSALIDMLLVGKFNKIKLAKLIKELETELGKEINFTVFDPQEFKYRRDITDIFLYGILEGKKMVVIDEVGLS